MKTPYSYECAHCGTIANQSRATKPHGWKWRGTALLCSDCCAPDPVTQRKPARLAA